MEQEKVFIFWQYFNKDLPLNIMMIGDSECGVNYYVERKKSPFYAIEYIYSGEGTFISNNKVLKTKTKDTIIIKKDSNHSYGSSKTNPVKKMWIVLDGSLIENLLNTYLKTDANVLKDCDISEFFTEIIDIASKNLTDYETLCNQISIVLHKMFLTFHKTNEPYSLANEIKKQLNENIDKRFNLDDLCLNLDYSKNHIIQCFKKEFGITPYQYLANKRIEIAKLYLIHTRISINAISSILQYPDQHYFSYSFKQATAFTPLEFRRKFSNKQD